MTTPRITSAFKQRPLRRRLRRYFLVGLVVIAPVGLTVLVLNWMFQAVDGLLGVPLQGALSEIAGRDIRIPGLGLVLLVGILLLVGLLVHLAAGRQVLNWWNHALARFPLTGRIYNAVSQITQSVVGRKRKLFHRTVLIPYPTDGLWAVAFVTNEDVPQMSHIIGELCVNVFVPTTPNPTSGFMLVVPRSRIRDAQLPVEEAMKLIISAGAVVPSDDTTPFVRRGLDLESLLKDTGEWKDTRSQ